MSVHSFQLSITKRKSERSWFSQWRSNESWWEGCCQSNSDVFFIRLWWFNHSAPPSSHRWLPPDQCALLSALRAKGRSMGSLSSAVMMKQTAHSSSKFQTVSCLFSPFLWNRVIWMQSVFFSWWKRPRVKLMCDIYWLVETWVLSLWCES